MLRAPILAAARSPRVRQVVERAPLSRQVVRRFVAGSTLDDAVAATRVLTARGLRVSLDHLGEETPDRRQAAQAVAANVAVLQALSRAGLADRAELSMKLTAFGLDFDGQLALDGARTVAAAAHDAGTTVTVDMEDHTRTEVTLAALAELRADFPAAGGVLQAMLHRTEGDCRALAAPGSRVRLCKGAYAEPESVAFAEREEIRGSYLRCLTILRDGGAYPMVATHDPAMITAAQRLLGGPTPVPHEFQMLYGVRPDEQVRLAAAGVVRVYVPYGSEWYGYLMRRLAERPANLTFFLRALLSRS